MPLEILYSDLAVGCALNMSCKPQFPSASATNNNELSSENDDTIGSCDVRIGYEFQTRNHDDTIQHNDDDELSLPAL
jgi:hypothetical protein